MICCPTLIGGIVLVLVFLVIARNRKSAQAIKSRFDAVKDKANSWPDTEITEFDPRTKIRDEDIDDLKERLRKRIVLPNLQDPENSPYGTPATYVNMVADHLTDSFDFGMINEVLCQFKHYKTVIGDLNLHFIHMIGSEEKKSTPILLLHGWPSSVWEFHKSIPILLKQGYTVVVPSLPGHGFTEPPTVTGTTPAVMGAAYNKLMQKLGYKKYVIHGGDWGAIIGTIMTYVYPENVLGLHNTMNHVSFGWRTILQSMIGSVFPSLVYTTKQEIAFAHPMFDMSRMYRQFAYFHAQSVMPDSYGFGMVDSPTGLIGWIGTTYAIASSGRDMSKSIMDNLRDGIDAFGLDNICANTTIFWCAKSAQASMRIYYEFYWNDISTSMKCLKIPNVPVAISNFPNEIIHQTKFVSGGIFGNLKQYNYHKRGGHFCHIDNTEAVVDDLVSFINKI